MCVLSALQDSLLRMKDIGISLLTIQGDNDKLCDKSGADTLHQSAISTDKKLSVRELSNTSNSYNNEGWWNVLAIANFVHLRINSPFYLVQIILINLTNTL